MNTVWKKYKGESFGTLELHLKSGVIKYFCDKYRSGALLKAKRWQRNIKE